MKNSFKNAAAGQKAFQPLLTVSLPHPFPVSRVFRHRPSSLPPRDLACRLFIDDYQFNITIVCLKLQEFQPLRRLLAVPLHGMPLPVDEILKCKTIVKDM